MVTVEQVADFALALPDVSEVTSYGHRAWTVGGGGAKNFTWVRPFGKADLRRFGDRAVPPGDILAVRVADLAEKEALLAATPDAIFTIPHFDGYAAVLITLERVERQRLIEALEDDWMACAPEPLLKRFLADRAGE